MTDKIIVDNGSVASKLLQYENKDSKVVKVEGSNIFEWFTKFDNKKDSLRIYLPFSTEDLTEDNAQRRDRITEVEQLGFKNLIVLPFDGVDAATIKQRAIQAGLIESQVLKGVTEDENKPYKSVRTTESNRPV